MQGGYLNGVFQTYFTTPWTHDGQLEEPRAVCAFYIPKDFIFLVDMGLHNAGWRMSYADLFDTIELSGDRTRFCWAREPSIVEVVSPSANPNHQEMLKKIYADDQARAAADQLVTVLDEVFQLIGSGLYSEIDLLMRSIDVSKAAPEYLVGLLRATSKEVRHLANWPKLLESVKAELRRRKLEYKKILIGLL
jgi:hypothetical protein